MVNGDVRCEPSATSLRLFVVLTGPSLAGSADRDMPGVGTFTYCGSPVVTVGPDLVAVDQRIERRLAAGQQNRENNPMQRKDVLDLVGLLHIT